MAAINNDNEQINATRLLTVNEMQFACVYFFQVCFFLFVVGTAIAVGEIKRAE